MGVSRAFEPNMALSSVLEDHQQAAFTGFIASRLPVKKHVMIAVSDGVDIDSQEIWKQTCIGDVVIDKDAITIEQVLIHMGKPVLSPEMISIRENEIVLLCTGEDETLLCRRDHIYTTIRILLNLGRRGAVEIIPAIDQIELVRRGVVGQSPLDRATTTARTESELQDSAGIVGAYKGLHQLCVVVVILLF